MITKIQVCDECGNIGFCKCGKNAKGVMKALLDVSMMPEAVLFDFSMTCKHFQKKGSERMIVGDTESAVRCASCKYMGRARSLANPEFESLICERTGAEIDLSDSCNYGERV